MFSNFASTLSRSVRCSTSLSCRMHSTISQNILSRFINLENNTLVRISGGPFIQGSVTYSTEVPKLDFVSVKFVLPDGQEKTVKAKLGSSLLDVVLDNHVGIDGFGACEGTLACSTCHLVFSEEDFKKLPTKPSDEELDMLDLAFGLTDTKGSGYVLKLSTSLRAVSHLGKECIDHFLFFWITYLILPSMLKGTLKSQCRPVDGRALGERSRLGCQIKVTESMNGLVVNVPAGISDAR